MYVHVSEKPQNRDATDVASASDHTRCHTVAPLGICVNLALVLQRRHSHMRTTFSQVKAPEHTSTGSELSKWEHYCSLDTQLYCCQRQRAAPPMNSTEQQNCAQHLMTAAGKHSETLKTSHLYGKFCFSVGSSLPKSLR